MTSEPALHRGDEVATKADIARLEARFDRLEARIDQMQRTYVPTVVGSMRPPSRPSSRWSWSFLAEFFTLSP